MEKNTLHEYITQTLAENVERHRVTNIVNGYVIESETTSNNATSTPPQSTTPTPTPTSTPTPTPQPTPMGSNNTPGENQNNDTDLKLSDEKINTCAEKVSIYYVKKGFSGKIPTLVILINHFLHYQTSNSLLLNF